MKDIDEPDPLDAVFITGDEAREIRRIDLDNRLSDYLRRMPPELQKHLAIQINERITADRRRSQNETQQTTESAGEA